MISTAIEKQKCDELLSLASKMATWENRPNSQRKSEERIMEDTLKG